MWAMIVGRSLPSHRHLGCWIERFELIAFEAACVFLAAIEGY